jgi:hypothetical protein
VLQRIATRMSLVSEAIGFWVLGILIIVNRHVPAGKARSASRRASIALCLARSEPKDPIEKY